MKISVKTLKGTSFDIQVTPDNTIVDVKKKIENVQGAEVYPADKQVLIYQGKVLKDTTTLEENNVADNSFLVIMLSKAKPAASVGPSATVASAGQAQTQTSTPPPTVPTLTAPPALSQDTREAVAEAGAPSSGDANVYGEAASNLVAGSSLETTIQQILDMGGGNWDRVTVLRALRAAFNNPERAVEYLYSGIPEQAEVPPPVARTPAGGQATDTPAQVPQGAIPSSGPNASPLDLFPQGLPNMGTNAGAGSLDFLRNSQQFQALRTMVQANPQILQPILQELGKQNPHLMRLIQEHQSDFLRLMNGPVEGESEGNVLPQLASGMPPPLNVRPEDREAIERLEGMGFSRDIVLHAYFVCNKDETLAANYLLDHMDGFENEDDHSLS